MIKDKINTELNWIISEIGKGKLYLELYLGYMYVYGRGIEMNIEKDLNYL